MPYGNYMPSRGYNSLTKLLIIQFFILEYGNDSLVQSFSEQKVPDKKFENFQPAFDMVYLVACVSGFYKNIRFVSINSQIWRYKEKGNISFFSGINPNFCCFIRIQNDGFSWNANFEFRLMNWSVSNRYRKLNPISEFCGDSVNHNWNLVAQILLQKL